jgi:Fe-S cluster assembly protein SufD
MTGFTKPLNQMETMEDNKVLQFTAGWSHPNDMAEIRNEARQALNAMDFPTTRVEDWKYTRTTKITGKTFRQEKTNLDVASFFVGHEKSHKLVFINGYYDAAQSNILDDAITIEPISKLNNSFYAAVLDDSEENVFSLINKAYSTDGVYIHVAKNKKTAYPVEFIHVLSGEGVAANVRHFIHLEEGAEFYASMVFNSAGATDSFHNIVLEGSVGRNAKVTIDKIQNEENTVFHLAKEYFVQDADSNFLLNTITIGGALVRNGLNILVEGSNCHTEINGVYLGKEKQHLDNHTFIDHLEPHCTSSETYKGVMDDQSTGVFNGKVIVRQDAQKIQAYQSNANILLSDKATVNSKPELEIYADDVRCSHGSTTGQLDDDALFYLRARGINEKSAKELLVSAFIGEVLDKVENETTRAYIDRLFFLRYGWEY